MSQRSSRAWLVWFIGFGVFSCVVSCVNERRTGEAPSLEFEGREHWVEDRDLREVMSSLVLSAPWPDRDVEIRGRTQDRQSALEDARDLSRALSQAAREIPALVAGAEMSEADRRAFNAQAYLLQEQADDLGRAARRGKLEDAQKLLEKIDDTCASCHTRFRDFSGLLGPREARNGQLKNIGEPG